MADTNEASDSRKKRAPDPPPGRQERPFALKVVVAVAITLVMLAVALFLWYSLAVLLLAFAAILVAIVLRGLAGWLAGKTRMPGAAALACVVLAIVGTCVLAGVLLAPRVGDQFGQLAERVPESFQKVQDQLRQSEFGRRLLDGGAETPATQPAPDGKPANAGSVVEPPPPGGDLASKAIEVTTQPATVGRVFDYGRQVLDVLFTVVLVLIVGIYLAAQPGYYVDGFLKLFPKSERPRLREVLYEVGRTLKWWMLGQLVPMAAIGILIGGGLWVIGVPLWLPLGVLAALLNFIPNFGPIIAAVPAVLIALAADPTKAIWVVVLSVVAQNLEGYLITPLVQRRAVEMPPALTILSQVLLGMLLGPIGVVLAAPLTAAAIVVVKMLYVEDTLKTPVELPGDQSDGKSSSTTSSNAGV